MNEEATVTIDIYEYHRLCVLEGKLDAVRAYCQKEDFPNAETMAVMLDIVVCKPLELYSPSNKDTINPYQE